MVKQVVACSPYVYVETVLLRHKIRVSQPWRGFCLIKASHCLWPESAQGTMATQEETKR